MMSVISYQTSRATEHEDNFDVISRLSFELFWPKYLCHETFLCSVISSGIAFPWCCGLG